MELMNQLFPLQNSRTINLTHLGTNFRNCYYDITNVQLALTHQCKVSCMLTPINYYKECAARNQRMIFVVHLTLDHM